ncbi:hypothetical protein OG738_29165 [Amycolatopsis sp. NBC_01488]
MPRRRRAPVTRAGPPSSPRRPCRTLTPCRLCSLVRTRQQWLERLYTNWRQTSGLRRILGPRGKLRPPSGDEHHTPFADCGADRRAALCTSSDRIEITSATIAGFGHPDCPGHPVSLPPSETGPLWLIANHPRTHLHSELNAADVSRAGKVAGREAIRLKPHDAVARGITTGDLVRVFNTCGACLASAVVDDATRPGRRAAPDRRLVRPGRGPPHRPALRPQQSHGSRRRRPLLASVPALRRSARRRRRRTLHRPRLPSPGLAATVRKGQR